MQGEGVGTQCSRGTVAAGGVLSTLSTASAPQAPTLAVCTQGSGRMPPSCSGGGGDSVPAVAPGAAGDLRSPRLTAGAAHAAPCLPRQPAVPSLGELIQFLGQASPSPPAMPGLIGNQGSLLT